MRNIVIMPKFNPLKPLTTPRLIPFAVSDIQLDAFLVKGHPALPELINHNDFYAIADIVLHGVNPERQGLFEKVGAFFSLNDKTQAGALRRLYLLKYTYLKVTEKLMASPVQDRAL